MNILTIDFDIIMAPSIMIYNDLVPFRSLEDLKKDCALFGQCKIDAIHYARLTRALMFLIENYPKEKIHFIHDHGRITKFVTSKASITNIDHHHDLSYGKDMEKEKLDNGYGCANWVRWLEEQNLLQNYTWIRNDNSEMPGFKNVSFKSLQLKDIDIEAFLNKEKYDEIVICFSEPWIPNEYHELFFLWLDLCNKYYHTHFNVED